MRRRVFLWSVLFTVGLGMLLTAGLATDASSKQGTVTVTVTPVGPSQAQLESAIKAVKAHPTVAKYLQGNQTRQLESELLELKPYTSQQRFRVTFYDYTNNRSLLVESGLTDTSETTVTLGTVQPLPSHEEFDAAVEQLKRHPVFGPGLRAGTTFPYRPMPPIIGESATAERTLAVGLFTADPDRPNQIVAVNMIRETVSTFKTGAPITSAADQTLCGVPGAGQGTTPRGTAGQYNLTIAQNSQEVWRMLVIRPSVSSGTRSSAVELRDIYYRGKLIMKRAHVPILNVNYINNACGPYRDWQWQEGSFIANGTDVAPGVRVCTEAPQTMMEAGSDTGNYRGVAIYQTPRNDVMLVSELEAGWYRYISRWEFTMDGVIRARFGFDGVNNSCVCNAHNHHAYFRFDFDLGTPGKNRFTELATRSFASPILTEAKRYRDYVRDRHWLLENIVSGEQIMIEPGHEDSTADVYARGDAWFLRYRSTELDDGQNSTGSNTEANLDQFVNGESLNGQDVVMWYAAHFYHVFDNMDGGGHLVGPDIIVKRW